MLISRYSKPEFDPYGDSSPEQTDARWPAPTATGPLSATVSLPGSKSLTNRELVLSALAGHPSVLRSPLHSRDSDLMVAALRQLGTTVEEVPGEGEFGPDLRITPGELFGSTTIDCGLAGTVMRFLPPVAALALGPTTFDGDAGARLRPMKTTISSLRALGADINDDGRGALPFTVHGTGSLDGGEITIDASTSSQFVSGLLLAAPRFERGLHLRHAGERLPSMPHIEMTIATLARRGVTVGSPAVGEWIVAPAPIAGAEIDIEPDLSNAAPFLAAALVAGGSVTITGWPESTTQVGADLAELLPLFGATVSRSGDRLTVTAGERLRGVQLDLSTGGELAPALVALAALADSPSTITGIGHIRHHETDRLAALAAEINGLGGAVTELPDGLQIDPRPLHGGPWRTYDDHRMATAGAVIGLAVPGVEIENIGTTAKTLPQFADLWQTLASGATS
ncbi:3-phosphoshikimate 1-carboxyvinyltransferase [Cryobacterium sp. TMT1-21]|uniref:3-phosphoshikimate 1-carboxyvinyltransferase n=1 Tax=Cryobacterium shii TaxID=1259235 RepID=A0AAQ2HG56_9MICO|nr:MULTISPECIES: 3-phosphoshikimate 1-carboxyvinyltransferase [Cryobacterium]TFC49805.1 3-phosphoshikimate 1-carboxyvinyltransferase [Cryobacterium shii]TFC81720.1 3-phosphoshikimate 1-carboxyvinyltransferase [Cryobacterium sp. TmT2-59]TFD14158.1 3-phosphoshikimate 1-carboxyvinyltransferase [Cryobacterium sp. TMT1-21]TFD16136.1 3-phosphoshikimate 1-carboxyvinyltransferase [Cryobacterium sp. TMT4-10]TFD18447.1 3-phosphoshikimate 1-carboxyvinyltransferase [Cryobacterium sp. TMT2-23]